MLVRYRFPTLGAIGKILPDIFCKQFYLQLPKSNVMWLPFLSILTPSSLNCTGKWNRLCTWEEKKTVIGKCVVRNIFSLWQDGLLKVKGLLCSYSQISPSLLTTSHPNSQPHTHTHTRVSGLLAGLKTAPFSSIAQNFASKKGPLEYTKL